MNTMYKEVIERKRVPVIVCTFLGMAFMISLCGLVERINLTAYILRVAVEPIFVVLTSIIILLEILKCKVKYKYSIIADQIIIHKLKNQNENIVENIKFKDIIFIGKRKDLREKLKTISSKRYVCSIFNRAEYCCIYKDGHAYRKFYFEPSVVFTAKLSKIARKK